MASLAGLKTISIVFLVVMLAAAAPVFAQDEEEAFITLAPSAACPGQIVSVTGDIPIDESLTNFDGGILSATLSSDPGGLMIKESCELLDTPLTCAFVVSESASCGRYTVTVTLTENVRETNIILGSASAFFDVAGSCCVVGGCVQPVNAFSLLSPWVTVIGLVGCIGTVVVVTKKRRP